MSGSKDVIDRVLLEERHKQAGTLALSFPWEQGIFKEILGNTAGLPALPVVEVPLDLPSSSAATLDDFVQVARAAATTEASNANHYRLAVERATWRACSKLSVGEQVSFFEYLEKIELYCSKENYDLGIFRELENFVLLF